MAVPNINKLIIKVIINKKKKLNFLYLKNAKHELNVFFGYRKRSKRETREMQKQFYVIMSICILFQNRLRSSIQRTIQKF